MLWELGPSDLASFRLKPREPQPRPDLKSVDEMATAPPSAEELEAKKELLHSAPPPVPKSGVDPQVLAIYQATFDPRLPRRGHGFGLPDFGPRHREVPEVLVMHLERRVYRDVLGRCLSDTCNLAVLPGRHEQE